MAIVGVKGLKSGSFNITLIISIIIDVVVIVFPRDVLRILSVRPAPGRWGAGLDQLGQWVEHGSLTSRRPDHDFIYIGDRPSTTLGALREVCGPVRSRTLDPPQDCPSAI